MSNILPFRKDFSERTLFNFLLWDGQEYYTIYRKGNPVAHCFFDNIEVDGIDMAGVFVLKPGESEFTTTQGIEPHVIDADSDEFNEGAILMRLLEGDDWAQTDLFMNKGAACNNPYIPDV